MYFTLEYLGNNLSFNGNDVDGKDNFVFDHFITGLIEEPDGFTDPSENDLTLLNNCVEFLNILRRKNPYNHIESLFTFIDEAATHREYCNPYVLKSFSSCLEGVLAGWEDGTAHNFDLSFKEYKQEPITADDIRNAYNKLHRDGNQHDFYSCRFIPVSSEESYIHYCYYASFPIQIIYSILMHHFKQRNIIKRCENCGRIFIPSRTSDKYCMNLTNGKTCGEIRKAEAQKKSHNKEINKTYKRIDNRLYQREAFKEQEEFRTGFSNCTTDEQRRQYLNHWNEKTYIRKPKQERQGIDYGKHKTK